MVVKLIVSYYFIPEENELVKPKTININKIDVKNEWNTEEITTVFDKYDRTLVNALLPGNGKS